MTGGIAQWERCLSHCAQSMTPPQPSPYQAGFTRAIGGHGPGNPFSRSMTPHQWQEWEQGYKEGRQ